MSAFICGPDHFKALCLFAAASSRGSLNVHPRYCRGEVQKIPFERDSFKLAEAYAEVLYRENIRSVRHRYPEGDLPGPITPTLRIRITLADARSITGHLPPISILKMCDCLEYQSCETDNYRETDAYDLLNQIRRAAINKLPGYDDAPWDYYAPDKAA